MSDSLRMRVVEAGARALSGRSEDAWERSTEQSKTQYRFRIEAAFDAMLDCLGEKADEWVAAASGNDLDDAMERGDFKLADVLLEVLRESP